jgi:hypothetical protein
MERCGDARVDQLLTLTFLLLHCTQPERVFLCAFRGAACMVIVSKTRTFVTGRELGTHVGWDASLVDVFCRTIVWLPE